MQTDEKQYTALIVDDQPDFIHLAQEILTTEGGFQVVGSATSCDEALLLLDRYQPDLALVDVHMPEMNGFELTKVFVVRSPRTQVVLVTSLPGPEWPALAGEAGAASLLGKAALSGIALRSLLGGALPPVAAG